MIFQGSRLLHSIHVSPCTVDEYRPKPAIADLLADADDVGLAATENLGQLLNPEYVG